MASNGTTQDRHVKLLKRQRGYLVNHLPDATVLLKTLNLAFHFSSYEQSEITKQKLPSEKAEKFLDIMEFKTKESREVYQNFLRALYSLKPEVAVKLEGLEREVSGGSDSSMPSSNDPSPRHVGNGYGDHMQPRQDVGGGGVEDAAPFGLSAPGSGPAHHISRLGYSGRELLARTLNGQAPQRQIFHDFCQALNVENRLVQMSSRSRNPTGYLIQQLCSKPDATLLKLEEALREIGQAGLYEELVDLMQNGGMDDEEN